MLGAHTPDPAVGGGRTKRRWLDCMRPTAKSGGPCSEPSRRRRDCPASTPVPRKRPYKMVLNKLRPWAPPTTESMDPRFLEEVVGTLFSGATDEENNRFTNEEEESRDPARSWSPESRVTKEELAEAIGRIGAQSPVQGSGPRRSHDPPVEGHRRGFGPEINASI